MSGIVGWIDWKRDLTQFASVLENMTEALKARGPDARGVRISTHCALGHRRLAILDLPNGAQPMDRKLGGETFSIVYNGEIYNAPELRAELKKRGHDFRTRSDTEVVLAAYMEWGAASVEKLDGMFAYAIWSEQARQLFLARDRFGAKPLFYAQLDDMLLFASEPKAILQHPDFRPEIGTEGLAEIFAVGPARTPGHGIFKQMAELKPGHLLRYDRGGTSIHAYWKLESKPHADSVQQTADTVRELLKDAVKRQIVADVPVCTLLSGGLDSSALTAIAADRFAKEGLGPLHTFSVDYVDNDKHFQANSFQPNADAPFIRLMTEHLGTVHHEVVIDMPELVDSLDRALEARDMPGMADIDGSLYLFSKQIKQHATVALSGESADELFGGYPWFHRKEMLEADTFPWSLFLRERIDLLHPDLVREIRPAEYVAARYSEALAEVPRLDGEHPADDRIREMFYLNITRFMPTLVDRTDRMSMAAGLEVRMPFCDQRLVEYVFNIPWEIKTSGMREKGILRQAMKGILPEEILARKKSPYPKTHHPEYMARVKQRLMNILDDPDSPLHSFIHVEKIKELARTADGGFNLPWFGQLMTGPQLFAYLIQVDHWFRKYRVRVVI